MTEGPMLDSVALDALLRDRAQYQGWLARIDENSSRVPASVTDKVRRDYESRLTGVLEQLKAHAGAVGTALDRLRVTLGGLETKDAAAAERLAEAELRHLVGEYDDGAWEALKSEVDGERRGLHADMEHTRQEISRLADVQAIILEVPETPNPAALAREAAVAAEAVAAAPPAPAPVPVAPPVAAAPPLPPGVTILEPEAPAEPATLFAPSKPKALDELDFLKSVTDEAAEQPAVATQTTTAAPEKGKAVRCRECGHDNRPSDWYCDRCGAEISDL